MCPGPGTVQGKLELQVAADMGGLADLEEDEETGAGGGAHDALHRAGLHGGAGHSRS